MDTFAAWLKLCDWVAAFVTEGMMTEDFEYDWRAAYDWGDTPVQAVAGAIARQGVHAA